MTPKELLQSCEDILQTAQTEAIDIIKDIDSFMLSAKDKENFRTLLKEKFQVRIDTFTAKYKHAAVLVSNDVVEFIDSTYTTNLSTIVNKLTVYYDGLLLPST